MDIIDNINRIMKKKGISGRELARQIGISESAISKWKKRESQPTVKNMRKIAEALGCQLSDLTAGVMPITGFSDESEAYGVVNDLPQEKVVNPTDPLTAEELAEYTQLLYEDGNFRAMCRTYGKVTRESSKKFNDRIQELREDVK